MSQAGLPVQTEPLATALSQPPAGFWIRVVAALIDYIIVLAPLQVGAFIAFSYVKNLPLFLLLSSPGFVYIVYKPLMESRYGATLGKMACGLRVIDQQGRRLSIVAAYVRFLPWLVTAVVHLITLVWVFSLPQFQAVSGFLELGRLTQQSPVHSLNTILGYVFMIDCVTAAFTTRKRAIHDMIAGSYCVWKVG
jgi:uncharacterized RDD family membrane protein YckC